MGDVISESLPMVMPQADAMGVTVSVDMNSPQARG